MSLADGREVLEILAYVPIAMLLRTGIAILSYSDQLSFGITGDFDTTPDIAVLAEEIEQAIEGLLADARAAEGPTRPSAHTPHGVTNAMTSNN